jgi:hypothetical protein
MNERVARGDARVGVHAKHSDWQRARRQRRSASAARELGSRLLLFTGAVGSVSQKYPLTNVTCSALRSRQWRPGKRHVSSPVPDCQAARSVQRGS